MKMRAFVITAASMALTGAVIANAWFQKHQFYPSVVYLTKSNPSMAVLYIQALVFVILLGKMMRKIFFGQLRAAEMEHLIERSWYAVTETCLAFTVFRDDFSPRFVAQFTLLLFLKCFHWLAEDRIDYMERSPILTWLFHVRAFGLLLFLGTIDSLLVHTAYHSTLQSGASVQLVFGFEYAILVTIVVTVFMKYVLHCIDLQSENPWDNKAVYLLYTELIMGFIKAVLYSCFMVIMIKVHTFPLFAIRPMYLTLRSFKKSLSDVIMSRRAIANMNTLYPDATPDELSQGDNVCIICREEMVTGCKKLPCNHIFHTSCLRSWFQRQQTCPTCRMDVLRTPPPQPPAQTPVVPPQQPAMVNPMANGQPMMPPFGMFPGWPPMAVPPPVPPPQPVQTPATPTSTTPTTSTGTVPTPSVSQEVGQTAQPGVTNTPQQIPAAPPPFMFPPLPFMMPPPLFGMPFGPPPAPPGGDLSNLTDQELRAMEGQERQNVEARIAFLRSIHSLLDTAIMQMNQYSLAVGDQSQVFAASSPLIPNTATSKSIPVETKPTAKETDAVELTSGDAGASSSEAATAIRGPSLADAAKELESIGATAMPEIGATEKVEDSSDNNEIRRRRLERFAASSSGDASAILSSHDTTSSSTKD